MSEEEGVHRPRVKRTSPPVQIEKNRKGFCRQLGRAMIRKRVRPEFGLLKYRNELYKIAEDRGEIVFNEEAWNKEQCVEWSAVASIPIGYDKEPQNGRLSILDGEEFRLVQLWYRMMYGKNVDVSRDEVGKIFVSLPLLLLRSLA